jgi:hypothetical protein
VAAVEIAFVLLSAIAGGMGEPWAWPAAFAVMNATHWGWSRRGVLGQIAKDRLPGQVALALGLIVVVHAGVYAVGRALGGFAG